MYTFKSKYRYFDQAFSSPSPSIVQVDTDMKIFVTVITEYLYPRLQKRCRRYSSTVVEDLPLELSRPPACRATGSRVEPLTSLTALKLIPLCVYKG